MTGLSRSLADIDADLAAYQIRRRRQVELLLGSLWMLDAIDQRTEVLLEHRHTVSRSGHNPVAPRP